MNTDPAGQAAPTHVESLTALRGWIGRELPPSPWLLVTQEAIGQFADATGDHQWIHVDPERAARESPFGGAVAHGFMTLSLLADLLARTVVIDGARMGVNYGLDRVRFTAPVLAGRRVRGRFTLRDIADIAGGVQLAWQVTVEQEGSSKPCCVAEWLTRRYA